MAARDKVKICNLALSNIGHNSSIESLTEGSPEADECNLWYDESRLEALEAYDWNFARKRLTLALSGDDAPSGVWIYRYQYPSDAVIIRKLQNPAGETADVVPYSIELNDDATAKTVLTNLSEAVAVYTRDLEAPSLFAPYSIKMLAASLASNIAFALTGKLAMAKAMTELFTTLSLAAPAFNANEDKETPPREAEWIRGRR